MRIAIVGAGVSGLVAARLLHARHEVTVIEAEPRLGGHANTVEVELAEGRVSVDTGFIVYNERSYPRFSALLGELGVASQPSEMSFSVSDPARRLEYRMTSLNTLLARRSSALRPGHLRMLGEIVRFNALARRLLAGGGAGGTLGEVLTEHGFSRRLRDGFVLPLGASIWSADPDRFDAMPFATYARFMDNHGLLSFGDQPRWRTVRGGAARYVEALSAPFLDRVLTGCPVDKVVREPDGVEIHLLDGSSHRFDAVVLACHSDQALRLLGDPSPAEESVLRAIGYQANEALLHTDTSLMPASGRAWASWNYHVPAVAEGRATLTYHMNRLQSIDTREQLLVTLNRATAVDPAKVIGRFEYAHPVLDAAAVAAQSRRDQLQGRRRTWYCGAYWGFGFHEDGVRSAYEACASLDPRCVDRRHLSPDHSGSDAATPDRVGPALTGVTLPPG